MKKYGKSIGAMIILLTALILSAPFAFAVDPGTLTATSPDVSVKAVGPASLTPFTTITGKVALSVDGLGTNSPSGIIQVEKPSAGATVRAAYLAAATTGGYSTPLSNGDVTLDGTGVTWNLVPSTPSSISSSNSLADVTSIVKPKVDAASVGRVDFTITEAGYGTYGVDGEILAVIFDDPSQPDDNTIVLLFGAQDVAGDTFAIGLADPINIDDPSLCLDMSLGISYGYQPAGQYSRVDVNGQRLTTSAGGQDDGAGANGALLTVGGLDDSNANPPNPFQTDSGGPRYDDELYNLIPFVADGDTAINVYTLNPSTDDNIFFSALLLCSTTAIVGEGIILGPTTATNPVGTTHTVIATVQDDLGSPIEGRSVTFNVISGPHAGSSGVATTDVNGQASFTYLGTTAGIDTIEASSVDSQQNPITSNRVTKEWIGDELPTPTPPPTNEIPEFPTAAAPAGIAVLGYLLLRRRNKK